MNRFESKVRWLMSAFHSCKSFHAVLFALIVVSHSNLTPTFADFNYANFGSTAGLNLVGSTTQFSNRLRLTAATTHQVGGVWTTVKQSVANGFNTSFAFQ